MNSRIVTIEVETVMSHYSKTWDKACAECEAPHDSAFAVFDPESKFDRRLAELEELAKNMVTLKSNTVLINRVNGASTYRVLPVEEVLRLGQLQQWREYEGGCGL